MSNVRTGFLLSLGILLFGSVPGRADTVPLTKLSEPLLRERVGLYLLTEEGKTRVVSVRRLARLRVEQITYRSLGGGPVRLAWEYEPIGMLTEAQNQAVEKGLEGIFKEVFGNFMGGLLSDTDAAMVFKVIVVRPVPPPSEVPPEIPSPRPPSAGGGSTPGGSAAAAPVPRLGIAWYYGCGGCCAELFPVYYYYYSYESSSVAVGRSSAASTSTLTVSPPRTDSDANWERQIMLARLKDAKDPSALYWRARTCYWQGDKGAALALLIRATELDAQDARYWYFRALAERALGEGEAAKESARRAAALKFIHRSDEEQIGLALERVQGTARRFLNEAVGQPLTLEIANQIARAPLPRRGLPTTPSSLGASSTEVASSRKSENVLRK